jgi:acyl-CoA reductase-like NAD-dependent aldehyde dehydrogenase
MYGHPHPRRRHLVMGFEWSVVNVSTGQVLETGVTDDEEDAEDAVTAAKEQAESADEARVRAELGSPQE